MACSAPAYAAVFRKLSGPTTLRTWKRSLPPVVSGVSSAGDWATAAGAAGSRTKTAQPARNNRVELALMPGAYAPRPAEDLPECLQSPSILSPPLRDRAQNLPEARIVTQWLGPRVCVQVNHVIGALLQSSLGKPDGPILFAHCGVDGRDVPRGGGVLQLVRHALGVSPSAGQSVGAAQSGQGEGGAALEIPGLVKLHFRVGVRRILLVGHTEKRVPERELRGDLQSGPVLFDGRAILACVVQAPAYSGVDHQRLRVEQLGLADLVDGPSGLGHGEPVVRVPVMGGGVPGIQGDGLLELPPGAGEVPIVGEEDIAERSVAFRERRVELHRL